MRHALALERLRRIGGAATESCALRTAALAEIGRAVPFDACVWLLTDPETSVGMSPLATVPQALMPELPRLIRLKYLTPVNRWTALSKAARLDPPAESLMWRELLHAHGVTDIASVVFRDRYGCWAFLDLWRLGGTFNDGELDFLDDVAALLTAQLRRCVAHCFETEGSAGTLDPGPVILVLDSGLRRRPARRRRKRHRRAAAPCPHASVRRPLADHARRSPWPGLRPGRADRGHPRGRFFGRPYRRVRRTGTRSRRALLSRAAGTG